MASPLKQQQLINSLHTGFIDKDNISLEKYRPRLLLNNHKQGKKVLSSIINELENCDEFFFSVAFITYSGVLVLLNTLKELESKGVRGKIVASQYLNFTDPTALRKLLEFENIELRMVVHEDLHSKGYIFKKDDEYNLIVGSSNLTQNALSKNKEWNIKVSSTDKGSLIEETLKEFEQTFHNSVEVNEQWLEQYDLIYRKNKENSERVTKGELGLFIAQSPEAEYKVNHDLRPKISPNKMQVKALGGIEKVRERGENKALLISATGTGKTYVYTHTIYELHKRYGLNKFIIAVPSLAIKAGTAQFLRDEYVKRHFSDVCGYGTEIEVGVLEAPKNKKKGRSYFPSVVSDFVKGSCQNTKKIYVLLVNMQLLVVRSNGMLSRDDYDYGVEGFYRPLDAIRATNPVVIIDEPHRFSRDQKAFKVIVDEIKPQCIIRFGATFPETTSGRGKNKITVKDYQNLLYDLNACEAFNQNLIKGVTKEHFEPVSKREEKVKITSITTKDSVTFQYKKRDESTKTFTLKTGDSLSIINEAFEGITIHAIGKSTVEFSNGIQKSSGEELDVDIYMTSYQEQMIRLALERHFETEKANFCGRNFKVKTLALFFIDDISSYRPNEGR